MLYLKSDTRSRDIVVKGEKEMKYLIHYLDINNKIICLLPTHHLLMFVLYKFYIPYNYLLYVYKIKAFNNTDPMTNSIGLVPKY